MQASGEPTTQYKALVVDDSPTLRRLIQLTLGSMGLGVDFAESGEDAIKLTIRNHYHIIFLDVVLPKMDGYRVCKILKANKKFRNIPVVMLTSKNTPHDKVKGIMAGTDLYLTKPLDQEKIISAARKYLPDLGSEAT